jgi:stress-induced morphogen
VTFQAMRAQTALRPCSSDGRPGWHFGGRCARLDAGVEGEPFQAWRARSVVRRPAAPAPPPRRGSDYDLVVGRTGTGDHLQVVIASPCFDGLSLVEQHRLVYDPLAEPLADGTIDELRIKTKGVQ